LRIPFLLTIWHPTSSGGPFGAGGDEGRFEKGRRPSPPPACWPSYSAQADLKPRQRKPPPERRIFRLVSQGPQSGPPPFLNLVVVVEFSFGKCPGFLSPQLPRGAGIEVRQGKGTLNGQRGMGRTTFGIEITPFGPQYFPVEEGTGRQKSRRVVSSNQGEA